MDRQVGHDNYSRGPLSGGDVDSIIKPAYACRHIGKLGAAGHEGRPVSQYTSRDSVPGTR